MDLKGSKILAKAKYSIAYCCPPAEAGGNSRTETIQIIFNRFILFVGKIIFNRNGIYSSPILNRNGIYPVY